MEVGECRNQFPVAEVTNREKLVASRERLMKEVGAIDSLLGNVPAVLLDTDINILNRYLKGIY